MESYLPTLFVLYIIGYALLVFLSSSVTKGFYKTPSVINKVFAIILNLAFVLLSAPVFFVVAYLFTNLKDESSSLLYGIMAAIILLTALHLWLVIKCVRRCIKLVRE
jgi:Na+-driven multidrug efflux pump